MYKKIYCQVPPEINLLRANMPALNQGSRGGGRVVYVFGPEDLEEVYRHEGRYPHRGEGIIKVTHAGNTLRFVSILNVGIGNVTNFTTGHSPFIFFGFQVFQMLRDGRPGV